MAQKKVADCFYKSCVRSLDNASMFSQWNFCNSLQGITAQPRVFPIDSLLPINYTVFSYSRAFLTLNVGIQKVIYRTGSYTNRILFTM